MAAYRVFAVPELLEHILTTTSMRDVLLAQCVNKTWKATIEGSPQLQRLLFMHPVKGGHLVCDEYQAQVKGAGAWLWRFVCADKKHEPDRKSMSILLNPFLVDFLDQLQWKGMPMSGGDLPSFEERLPASWLRPEASWRAMLITQPASSPGVIVRHLKTGEKERVWLSKDDEDPGLRAGELLDMLSQLYDESGGRMAIAKLEGWNLFARSMEIECRHIEQLPQEDKRVWEYAYGADCYETLEAIWLDMPHVTLSL